LSFFSEKWQGFLGRVFFVVPPKFDQNNFFQKFKKNLVWKGSNKKWPETLISEYLVAVNPYGLQAKKPDFHVSTVKSRSNQIWIFLFEGFNLAHSSNPSTFEVFGTRILAAKCLQIPILASFVAFLGRDQ
jgi:hypothetical protein